MLRHFRSGSKRIRTLWWVLTIGTVVTFIGGFIFIFGSGVGDISQALNTPSVVGSVGDSPISQAELSNATKTALAQYKGQYGTEPTGRDAAILHEQVWNNLLTERAIEAEAARLGIKVSDPEVVFAIKNTPPPDIAQSPALQTNGRFDPAKWEQLLSNPSQNWAWLEDRMRRSLPGQRLEERIIAGVKFSEPELQRLYDMQYHQAAATVAALPLDMAPIDSSKLSDAALKAYYQAHAKDFTGPAQVQVDVVSIPRTVGADEERAAQAEAQSIVQDARRPGSDFAALAREHSEGPYAEQGGDLGQDVPLARLPASLQTAFQAMPVGGVTDPIREGNTYFVFRLNDRKTVNGQPAVRLSQIQKPIQPSQESINRDAELILKLRKEAASGKLGEAAAKRQLVSVNTGWFAQGEFVPMFVQLPQVQQWALSAKKGEVSRAFSNETGWVVAQVADRRDAGPRPFEAVKDAVRGQAVLALRQAKPMAQAERIVQSVRAGQPLEAAAKANGATVFQTPPFARSKPDPRIVVSPRAVGMTFGLGIGQVGPPVATTNGVLIVRKDSEQSGSAAQFDSLKSRLSQELLTARQRRYVSAWVQKTLADTRVEDKRQPIEQPE